MVGRLNVDPHRQGPKPWLDASGVQSLPHNLAVGFGFLGENGTPLVNAEVMIDRRWIGQFQRGHHIHVPRKKPGRARGVWPGRQGGPGDLHTLFACGARHPAPAAPQFAGDASHTAGRSTRTGRVSLGGCGRQSTAAIWIRSVEVHVGVLAARPLGDLQRDVQQLLQAGAADR